MKNKNKGFTVIEMVVTMLVLAIVLTLSIGGLLAWQDWANFNRQNEYAKMLFVAAQNQLSEYGADGRLQELQDSLSGGFYDDKTEKHYTDVGLNLTDHITALKNAEGNSYGDLGSLYPESGDKGEDTKLYQGEIVSLRAQTGDYAFYLANPAGLKASDPEAYWVFEILGAYVYDTSILNGDRKADGSGNGAAICVELTPDDGQVLAVLYSDRKDRFIYKGIAGDPSEETDGVADITDRTESYRRERMVGYYGVDTLYKATKGEILEPSLAMVRLRNEDDFYLACRLSAKDRVLLTSRLTYTLNLHSPAPDNDKLLTLLTITLDGTKLKKKDSNNYKNNVIPCHVIRYGASENAEEIGDLPILAWVEPDYTVHVVLDAADIRATSSLYKDALPYIQSDEANDKKEKFLRTFSYFRFGVKDDNLFASVSTSGVETFDSQTLYNFGNLNPSLNQRARHATFAGEEIALQEGKTTYTYSIKNARHLYNVRYIEDLSYEQEETAITADAGCSSGTTFQVKSDIDWKAFQTEGNLYDSYNTEGNLQLSSLDRKLVDETGGVIDNVTRYNCDFPSISRLRTYDQITGGYSLLGDKVITGLSVSELSNQLYGSYIADGRDESGIIKQDKTHPVGFVNVNYGTIRNLKLDGIRASGRRFVGAFCGINAGTIWQLETLNTLDKDKNDTSVITGEEYVGGIMGFQMPTEEEIKIEHLTNRAKVQGVHAVGGITGMVRNDFSGFSEKIVLSELKDLSDKATNNFKNNPKLSIKISECKNYGIVAGKNSSDLKEILQKNEGTESDRGVQMQDPEEPRYIGGIVGYVYNREKENGKDKKKDTIIIEECTSAPQYEAGTLEKLTERLTGEKAQEAQEQMLKGIYVGGIAGYNYHGQIKNCSTKAEKGKVGCLFGYRYVGGIVGFHIGSSDGSTDSAESDLGAKTGVNENHVVAYEYAGGITGCNANAGELDSKGIGIYNQSKKHKDPEELKGILVPDTQRDLKIKLENWDNQGVIIAVNEYSGGITGYNTGWIYHCNSKVAPEVADQCFSALYSGNYAGGIAGYNNGIIGNTQYKIIANGKEYQGGLSGEQISAACYVKGHHYVGGIVGYNDVDAVVEDYEIDSGYVLGDGGSCFVGGYAGLNVSVDLLMDRSKSEPRYIPRYIHSNPARVEGSYMVGGVIGGNIINMADNSKVNEINGVFMTDNFLGIMKGRAFIGGFVGYNLLINEVNDEKRSDLFKDADDNEKNRGAVYIVQRRLVDAFERSDSDASASDEQKLVKKKEILDQLFELLKLADPNETHSICISGLDTDNTTSNSYFGSITGEIFVGGVVGYNDANTKLTIKNVVNETAIEAKEAIECKAERIYRETDYAGKDIDYTYSYAGGMIGKVSANTTLYKCRNASAGTVHTAGTYTGGLCEVNEGTVTACQVSSFGSSTDDYVGGLCGLNKSTITNCTFENATVSGRNMVGGIAAENFGTISDITLEDATLLAEGIQDESEKVRKKHGVAGLYAAFNGVKGTIKLTDDISAVLVQSGGRYAGLVVGVNEGKIKNEKKNGEQLEQLVLQGTVRGYQSVGGLIGMNKDSKDLLKLSDPEQYYIQYYTNEASVTATNGNAGGIIGENQATTIIQNCVNNGIVTATDEGNAGGITSSNNGRILNCKDHQTVSAPGGKSGGITAVNERTGEIRSCLVSSEQEGKFLVFQSAKVIGAIAAENSGFIGSNLVKNVIVSNQTDVQRAVLGMVVGENVSGGSIVLRDSRRSGLEGIFSESDGMALENCKVIVQSNYSEAGGIAGNNAGTIQGGGASNPIYSDLCMENATIADLGGVAGVNSGKIWDIAVDAEIKGELGSEATGYGGIVGRSGSLNEANRVATGGQTPTENYAAMISNCSFDGVINAEGSSGAPVRIGGIVGINGYASLVSDCAIGVLPEERSGQMEEKDKNTYVTAGDYKNKTSESVKTTDTKSYSYLGGIVGDNYGSILACDNYNKSKDSVKVIGFAGETGGIAGYNEKYGVVSGYLDGETEHYLTTGKNWIVDQRCCGNDRGPGGIIGKSVSAEDISYVKNYASVRCDYPANTYVAGLIGLLGQQYAQKTAFHKCDNFGKITSSKCAGGLVGMVESNGADFTECNNWGDVEAKTENGGGLVSMHYSFAVGLNFRHCANHGRVYGEASKRLGGFLGGDNQCIGGIRYYFYDCVNTGIIHKNGETQPTSNVGSFIGHSQTTVFMELCRNYNTDVTTNGFVGNGGTKRFKNCLDNSGGVQSNNSNMFYLDKSSITTFSQKDYGVYFSFHEGPNGDFKYNGFQYRDQLKDPSYLFAEPDKYNKIVLYRNESRYDYRQLNISLDYDTDSQGLDSMVVYFWNGADAADSGPVSHTHSVTATYLYSDKDPEIADGYYDVVPEAKVVLKNPSGDKKPVGVRLKFADTSTEVKLRGISYIPEEERSTQTEAVCTYLGNKYDTEFSISEISKVTKNGEIVPHRVYNDQGPFKQTLPTDTWYCYPDDVLDIDWAPYSNYRLEYSSGDSADITFEVGNGDHSPGMDAFVFYLANENTDSNKAKKQVDTRYYEYSVTFTDARGNSVTTTPREGIGFDSGEVDFMSNSRQVVEVPEGLSEKIDRICLHIRATHAYKNGIKYENINGRIYFRGFRWIPKRQTAEQKMAAGTHPSETVSYFDGYNDSIVRHIKLKVANLNPQNRIYSPIDHSLGFDMKNDPINVASYYEDDRSYEESKTADRNSGSRIDTYLELDPQFVQLTEEICTSYRKLDLPSSLAMEDQNGNMKYTWKRSKNAYAYEVYYEIKDASDSVVSNGHEFIGSLQLEYNVPIDNSWKDKGCVIKFDVRAINAYHMDHNDTKDGDYAFREKYDSDWASTDDEKIDKMALPKPEVHMEVVAGNRTTFVLDNYEEYEKQGCTDCTIKVYFKGKNYDWDVSKDRKYRKPEDEPLEGSHGSPTDFQYYAEPNEKLKNVYTSSEIHYQRGEGMLNTQLEKKDRYCNTSFRSFFGTQADSMEYQVMFTLDSLDTYLMTDISAYDKTVGATVVYDSEITHAANSNSKGQLKLTSTLKNLPEHWFASDCADKITVRAYPYHSQFDLIHYGHPVAEGIILNGNVKENRAVLAGIYDKAYIAKGEDAPSDDGNCIWDEKKQDLKNGYLLQKQEGGTYDVIYSSVIELSKAAALEQREKDGNAYREYYNYAVAYRIYSNMAVETNKEIVVNSADFQESYWTRGMTDSTSYKTVTTDSNKQKDVQEIQPAPIVNTPVITKDDQGHTVYEFSWDTYYQDTACWNNNAKRYYDKTDDKLTDPKKGLFQTWDSYMKKLTQAGLSKQQISDGSTFCGLMNVYYKSYRTAKYRVDLIGTTQEGKEVILASQTVDDSTQQKLVENMTTKGGKPTTYNVWDYRCRFTDTDQTWKNYPKMTARVMRLGNLSTIEFYKSGGTLVKPVTDPSGASCMLPRYTDTDVFQKLRLNTISKPTVSLLKENGQFITDDLIYEVKWGAITNKNQMQDLGGYLITAFVKEAADQANTAKTHYYYVSDPGREGDTINPYIQDLETKGVVVCVQDDYEKSADTCKTRINLSDFNTGDVVQISVKAIAGRKLAKNYMDGEEGVTTEIKIPTRLAVPDTQKLKLSGGLCTTDTIDMAAYRQGLSLQYTADGSYSKVSNARMKLAAAVFDAKPDGAEGDQKLTNTADWKKDAYRILYQKNKPLDLGKISAEGTSIVDVTEFERYPGEFAGKWLKLVLKASSATRIDSQWTDQDPDEKTTNYIWVQLPNLKLADVDLKELSETDEGDVIRYAYDGELTNESQYENRDTQIASKSLRFSEDKNVNGYQITLTGKEEDLADNALSENSSEETGGAKRVPIYHLYLQRHLTGDQLIFDGTWDVYLATEAAITQTSGTAITQTSGAAITQSSGAAITEPTGAELTLSEENSEQAACIQNQDAAWLGTVGEAFKESSDAKTEAVTLLDLPQLQKELQLEAGNPGRNTYAITAQLRYTAGKKDGNGNGAFTIVLPDVTMIGDAPYAKYYFTETVQVEQYVKGIEPEETVPYEAGKGAKYTRDKGIELTAIQKGGDGPDEAEQNAADQNTEASDKELAKNNADGQFRRGDGHGIDRWGSRADILPVSPFTGIFSFFTDYQADGKTAVQAACAGLVRVLGAGTDQFLLQPVGIFI